MALRRVQIIEGMFLDIATKEERQKVDELYAARNKGSAIVYMLKRIRDHWVVMINKEEKNKYPVALTDTGNEKVLKINYAGTTWFEKRV